jgi:two-component system chemotaxis response regulator CheB
VSSRTIRVIVVDDSLLFRTVCARALRSLAGVEVVATASGGRQALERIRRLGPDLVTLDIHMADMTGVEVLQQIRSEGLPVDCVMVSGISTRESRLTMRALELGALDFIAKAGGSAGHDISSAMVEELARVVAVVGARMGRPGRTAAAFAVPNRESALTPCPLSRVVGIGVSTGGPRALAEVLPCLPRDLSVPVLVVQHMPEHFTRSLAERLDAISALRVREGRDGDPVRSGQVIIAPGGRQMGVASRGGEVVLRVVDATPENSCRPSADFLFRSLAQVYGSAVTGVIMTGMGRDGCAGLQLVHEAGGTVLAQDGESCTVFGMPARVIEAGLAHSIVPLRELGAEIMRTIRS